MLNIVTSKLRSYVWIGLEKEEIRRMEYVGRMLEQTLCLACMHGKGMERVEHTFYSFGIWVNVLKRRYNTCF